MFILCLHKQIFNIIIPFIPFNLRPDYQIFFNLYVILIASSAKQKKKVYGETLSLN